MCIQIHTRKQKIHLFGPHENIYIPKCICVDNMCNYFHIIIIFIQSEITER
jgi:hypothetical protein